MRRSVCTLVWLGFMLAQAGSVLAGAGTKRVAALTTVYRQNSHADIIVSRLLLTDMLDGSGKDSPLKLASLYTDQRPANDISRLLAASHRFPIYSNIADTLTLGTDKLAVDGVLLIAEHGDYPRSTTGNTQYPKRRFWDEMIQVFRRSGRVVPVFVDKHLADNWIDAKHIYDTARELRIPLMAGSSVPGSWRHPAVDVDRDADLSEVAIISYGSTDHYGFHALECLQSIVEQRRGGETGVQAVQCVTGDSVWTALENKRVDPELFQSALGRVSSGNLSPTLVRERVKQPILWLVEYKDGLRASVMEMNGAANGWAGAWRYRQGGRTASTQFWTQEARPGAHFTLLLNGIERMMLTGNPSWNVQRTLMSSGLLDALLQSCSQGGKRLEVQHLEFGYQQNWRWTDPPPPPPSRPWGEQ
jgi:hypothetical protein